MTDLTVANTIVNQMGGMKRLRLMVGADKFVGDANGVQFSFKGNRTMNRARIDLNGLDLYDIAFWKFGKSSFDKISEHTNVYFDQLIDFFESETGLYLSL